MAETMTETDTATDTPAAAPATDDLDLDKLLAEFDSGTAKPAEQPHSVDQNERERAVAAHLNASIENLQLDSRRAELQSYERQLAFERDQKDAAVAFETIRGNLPADLFSNEMLDSWITGQAVRDPAIQAAWQNRAADPKAYQRTLNKLASEFGEKFRRFQPEAEVDHAAVAQAVRDSGGKIPAEAPPDFGRMSDAEIHAWKRANMPGY